MINRSSRFYIEAGQGLVSSLLETHCIWLQQAPALWGFNSPNENIPRAMNSTQQTPVWTRHSAGSYQRPGPGRGRPHSCLPSRRRRCSSTPAWWHWGPACCHTDWRRSGYSSILSFLLRVDLLLSLKRKQARVLREYIKSTCIAMESKQSGLDVPTALHLRKAAFYSVSDSSTSR